MTTKRLQFGRILFRLLVAIWPLDLLGAVIEKVTIGGENQAEILFHQSSQSGLPSLVVDENSVELTFSETSLRESLGSKLEFKAPHALISRITVFPSDDKVKARVVVRGSLDQLAERVKMMPVSEGSKVVLKFPRSLTMLENEKLPAFGGLGATFGATAAEPQSGAKPSQDQVGANRTTGNTALYLGALFIVFILGGVGLCVLLKVLRARGRVRGGRKFLIENLAYHGLGAKTGIALLRVNQEFVLIGITPQSITLLSHLPKLETQYEEENAWERGVFKEALHEEVKRERHPI